MRKASRLVLGAGLGGLVVWVGVRGSNWLKGELAYWRWRRQRAHTIILLSPERDRRVSGRTLVWDDRRDRAAS